MALVSASPAARAFAERSPRIDSMVGTTLGMYRILGKIGEGGMGQVYLGEHSMTDEKRAIKVLSAIFMHDEEAYARFVQEARTCMRLESPHIVRVYDIGLAFSHAPFLVMEYLEGQDLRKQLDQGSLSVDIATSIALQMCDGLEVAHKKNVVHRDLKPENILLVSGKINGRDVDRFVKIVDFGLAKCLDAEARQLTRAGDGRTRGTPEYMSPEQAMGNPLDQRSDIYALGVIFYQMVTGILPFDPERVAGMTEPERWGLIMRMQIEKPPIAPRRINPEITEPLEAIILKALAKKPEDRYQTAVEMRTDIEFWMQPPSELRDTVAMPAIAHGLTQPGNPLSAPLEPVARNPVWGYVLMAVSAAIIAAGGALLFLGNRTGASAPGQVSAKPEPAAPVSRSGSKPMEIAARPDPTSSPTARPDATLHPMEAASVKAPKQARKRRIPKALTEMEETKEVDLDVEQLSR